jgi:hypothetical protein
MSSSYYDSDSETVSIPSDAEHPPIVPATDKDEWYGLTDGRDVKVITSEIRDVPGDNPDKERFLDIGVMIDGVFVHTSPFRDHTRFTSSSGSKASKFVTQMGANPTAFQPKQLLGLPVIVQVKLVERTDKESGEKIARNHISNIRLKE